MGKFSFISFIVCVFSLCVLFGLPYVGVALADTLLCIIVISALLCYLTIPKEIKNTGKKISSMTENFMQETFKEINKNLDEANKNLVEKSLSTLTEEEQEEVRKETDINKQLELISKINNKHLDEWMK